MMVGKSSALRLGASYAPPTGEANIDVSYRWGGKNGNHFWENAVSAGVSSQPPNVIGAVGASTTFGDGNSTTKVGADVLVGTSGIKGSISGSYEGQTGNVGAAVDSNDQASSIAAQVNAGVKVTEQLSLGAGYNTTGDARFLAEWKDEF